MTHDKLDRVLSRKDEIVPSSGFVSSVMDAVRQEATAPAPIPFPWRRALPGMVAAAITLVSVFVFFALEVRHLDQVPTVSIRTMLSQLPATTVPIAAAFLLTLASIMFSRRFTSN